MTRTLTTPKPQAKPAKEAPPAKKETARDLIEQIVVAFILAFLIRGFEAEAFVIPTGSMAPTLYGQHKEVTCPQCGELFGVNAAEEAESGRVLMVDSASCPNCRYRVRNLRELPSFKGDRILVMKFLYNLPKWLGGMPPQRWDVIVFHFPEEPETNYIKRLIGLPGEIIRLYFGDIYTKPNGGEGKFGIARKPLAQQQAMQQLVWDDSHRPKAFADRPEWKRWRSAGGWTEAKTGVYRASGAADRWTELGYRHLVPSPAQWDAVLSGQEIPGIPRPVLITDLYGYNTGAHASESSDTIAWFNPVWVGDLTVSGKVRAAAGKGGELRLDLVEGGIVHRCAIDLKTGDAILSRGGKAIGPMAATGLRDDGREHEVAFANVDDRLTLWVDGKTPFGEGVTFEAEEKHAGPTAADLAPVAIAARGGEVEVSGLVLKRDIYYTQHPNYADYSGLDIPWSRSRPSEVPADVVFSESFDFLADPARFAMLGELSHKDFPIAPGRYMMMGDNSPRSSDSRAWSRIDSTGAYDRKHNQDLQPWAQPRDRSSYEVPESLIIGKAFFIYWPHGVPWGPNFPVFSRDFRFPFRPYFERMRWIR